MGEEEEYKHFKGKEALEHVIEAKEAGIVASAEIHGTEISGPISSCADACRETTLCLALIVTFLQIYAIKFSFALLAVFAFGWLLWKAGRAAWLGWARLERLHRIVQEERWEIEHHRQQERDELRELYRAKGFEGKLLEDVLDVLMADGDRLLRVMVEEELGLTLENQEHPLKQSIGACIGVIFAWALTTILLLILPHWGHVVAMGLCLIASGWVSARYSGNEVIPSLLWNLGIGALAFGAFYFALGALV